jgi:lysophospholipase L1-like esterase
MDTHCEYIPAAKDAANELGISCIDINVKTSKLISESGIKGSEKYFLILKPGEYENYPDGIIDNTHLSEEGSIAIAKMVVEGIKEQGLKLAEYIL